MDEDQEDIEEDPEGEAEDQLLAKLGTEMDSSLFYIRYLTCSSIKGNHKVPIRIWVALLPTVLNTMFLYCCK